MDWKDIRGLLGSAAPIVGTLIGGPAGTAIGTAVAGLLGVEDTPDAVARELKGNPEALVKLKQYEMEHSEKLQAMQLDAVAMQLADVQSARSRQTEHEKATGATDVNLYVLAWTIVAGFFGLIGTLVFVQLPNGSDSIVYMLFGTLSAGFGSVMQYFFGSSVGSKQKDTTIQKMKITKEE